MTRVYPLKRPAFRVEVRRDGSPWQWRSSWHELRDAMRDVERAGQERGWMLSPLHPWVQIVDADKRVVAAFRLGRPVMVPAVTADAGGAA